MTPQEETPNELQLAGVEIPNQSDQRKNKTMFQITGQTANQTTPDLKAARKSRAASATARTVAADHRVRIDDVPRHGVAVHPAAATAETDLRTVFGEDELASMPVVVRRLKRNNIPVQVWRTPDGKWWRNGGQLRVQIDSRTGIRSFIVWMAKGATRDDVEFLLTLARLSRAGEAGSIWAPLVTEWADEKTFLLAFSSRSYADPYQHVEMSGEVDVCDVERCREGWHTRYAAHVSDEITSDLPKHHGSYTIRVIREWDAPNSGWIVELYTDDFYGDAADVASLLNDLKWAQAECDQANAEAPR